MNPQAQRAQPDLADWDLGEAALAGLAADGTGEDRALKFRKKVNEIC